MPRPAEAAAVAEPLLPRPFRVVGKSSETSDTFTLSLAPEKGRPAAFLPGQFNMLYVPGVGEVPISASGEWRGAVEHTIRSVGPVTAALDALRKGDAVGLRGPYGTPWPLESAEGRDLVVLAGGIGLAPLRPAIRAVLAERRRYGRFYVLVGARSPSELLYRRELARWRAELEASVMVTVDRGDEGWRGRVGVVTTLMAGVSVDPGAVALLCGPEVMLRFAAQELLALGLSAERIHVSMERNMRCAVGFCGHCQFGPAFICKDGPVLPLSKVEPWLKVRGL